MAFGKIILTARSNFKSGGEGMSLGACLKANESNPLLLHIKK